MTAGIFELGAVVLLAAVFGVLAKVLRQPLVLAYLIAGIVLGQVKFGGFNGGHEVFGIFSELGIMLLLFLVGLEINYSSLVLVGKQAVVLGLCQVIFTAGIGYLIGLVIGFTSLQSLYLGIALTFSSTVIVIKLLSEKRDLHSLYGKLSLGILLVQDFIAILILVVLAGVQSGGEVGLLPILGTVFKGLSLFMFMVWLGRKILPLIFNRVARSHELLFLMSLAWVFLVAGVVEKLGFSIEIAGFLAGIGLANSLESFEIISKIRPLRDFFILIFFASLGLSITSFDLAGLLLPILVFSLFVLIGNPLIVMTVMGFMGYRKRTSFMTGVSIAQISEFSLVLAAMGLKLEHIDSQIVSLITGVGIVTILLSSYSIVHSDSLFKRMGGLLSIFERRYAKREDGFVDKEFAKAIVLIGAHRTGSSILTHLPKEHVLVIDFDPSVIQRLGDKGYEYIFADSGDLEALERANLGRAMLVISTSPDIEDNLGLIRYVRQFRDPPRTIVRAEEIKEVEVLYQAGADYVIFPQLTAGQYVGKTISLDPKVRILDQLRKSDIDLIRRLTT